MYNSINSDEGGDGGILKHYISVWFYFKKYLF